MNMSITHFSFDGSEIRCTSTGQPSVFDMIRVLGGKKNPHDTWNRICGQYPDTLGKCESVFFPDSLGRKGRTATPVAKDKEAAFYILGLLPGAAGRTYREEAAKLFVRYLEADTTLAEDVIRRSDNVEGLEKVAKTVDNQIKYSKTYHGVHGELALRNSEDIHHATLNKHNNLLAGVEKGQRKHMSDKQRLILTVLQGAEQLKLSDSPEITQAWDAVNTCKRTGNEILNLLLKGA